jgi:hypothetical protein
VIRYPELEAASAEQRARLGHDLGDPGPVIDWAKGRLAPAVIDWADTIVVHHFPEQWIGGQWDAIADKRVVWRTCGQSDPRVETVMAEFRFRGMQIVRYSPRERAAFRQFGAFAGEDTLIRFGKDPAEWYGWRGDDLVVGNITQHMRQRGDACGYRFWAEATEGLPTLAAGPGSEAMGGIGSLDYDEMRDYLRRIRVYLYTGTRPASYTLGLIEAMMTGTPIVTMAPEHFQPSELYEARLLVEDFGFGTSPEDAGRRMRSLLDDRTLAAGWSAYLRHNAIRLFGMDGVMADWRDFLGIESEEAA